jgi:glycerol-3-phosphate acyltransferase PlsY
VGLGVRDQALIVALAAAVGYLAGSITFGYWLVRLTKGVDIRSVGSGNIGATNVWRTYGRMYGLPVVLLDMAKAFIPALVFTQVDSHLAGVVAGAAAMLGHWRPLFLGFTKGGKMVATAGGAFLGVAPEAGGVCAAIWILLFLLFRYASLASMLGSLSLPAVAAALGYGWPVIAFGGAAAVGVILLHRANIRRLLDGSESRFQLRRRGPTARAEPSSGPAP